ncbi:hypothetical protein, partial [Acinetobacter baumannii]|uniref:hypothetical protein n=1 Tax=Acinetobacter baumannii TaxID=470 RepID=UPI0013D6BF23
VETSGELKFLCREDCSEAQGYFLGRPGPIGQFRYLVDQEGADAKVAWAPHLRVVSFNAG